jgi:hypothetical protein
MKRAQKRPKTALNDTPSAAFLFFQKPFWPLFFIVLAAVLSDLNSWGHQFVIDDAAYILQNNLLNSPRQALQILVSPLVPNAASWGFMAMYRPLTALSFGMNLWISGPNPDSFHLINRLLHVLICLLIYRIVRRLLPRSYFTALVASLLFAVHPLQTEAITYIDGRADALALFFFLLAWLCFLRLRSTDKVSPREYIFSVLCYCMALLSKENAVTWLGVILLTELVYFSQRQFKVFLGRLILDWRLYAGYIIATGAYLAIRFTVLKGVLTGAIPFELNPLAHANLKVRLLTGLKIMFECLGQAVWPAHFMPDYSYNQIPMITAWFSPAAVGTLVLTALFLTVLFWSYHRLPTLFFGLGFFLVTYSVVSNVLIPIGTIRADRLMYMPVLGVCLAVTGILSRVWGLLPKAPARIALCGGLFILLTLLTARTVSRNDDWKDEDSLYLSHLDALPNSSKLLNSIGTQLIRHERAREALVCFQRSMAMAPYPKDDVQLNLGAALRMTGDVAGALEQYDALIRRNPENAIAHYGKGNLLFAEGKFAEAVAEYKRSIEIDPHLAAARTNLNVALERLSEVRTPGQPNAK